MPKQKILFVLKLDTILKEEQEEEQYEKSCKKHG